jgi:hypothetical protein
MENTQNMGILGHRKIILSALGRKGVSSIHVGRIKYRVQSLEETLISFLC